MAEGVTRDDLRAAVASGVIDEAQAVSLQTLSDQRMGYRANMIGDDEPFELFKGFAEIFVTVGLGLLLAGFIGLTALFGDAVLIPIVGLGLSWIFALYFTKKRRMSLPSIALCLSYALSVAFIVWAMLLDEFRGLGSAETAALGLAGMIAVLVYFRVFRLPFAMFVVGMFGIIAMVGIVELLDGSTTNGFMRPTDFFDLRGNPNLAIGTLVFGLIAFVAALYFDTKDPHRISRYASTAFWLHILAAPALVNTLVMSNYTMGGAVGTSVSIVILTLFTFLAIVIDRRSFLTAGLIYMGLLLAQAVRDTGTDWAPVITLLTLGFFVTVLGAFWTQARAVIMGALPDFPGKDRLPPYADGLAVSE